MTRIHWQDWLLALAGVWLILLPFTLRYDLAEGVRGGWVTASFALPGLAIAILAAAAALFDQGWEDWVIAILGAWVTVSPWLLGFTATGVLFWSAVLLGPIVVALAVWSFADLPGPGTA